MIISSLLLKNEKISKIINNIGKEYNCVNDNFNIMLLATDFFVNKESLFVVLPNLYAAQKYYDELINVVDEDDVLFYPADELITAEMLISSGDFKFERINTITSLIKSSSKKLIVTHLNGVMKYQMSKETWANSFIKITTSDQINITTLLKNLTTIGYEFVYTVSKCGQFSKRGSIIDIFPFNYSEPIRLDLFDDYVEAIKTFDIEMQTSKTVLSEVEIFPITEVILDEEQLLVSLNKLRNFIDKNKMSQLELVKFNDDYAKMVSKSNMDMFNRYINFFTDNKKTLFDFVDNKKIYFIDKNKMETIYDHIIMDLEEYCCGIGGYNLLKLDYFMTKEKLFNLVHNHISHFDSNYSDTILAKELMMYHSNMKNILVDLQTLIRKKYVIVSIKNQARLDRFKELCLENSLYYGMIKNPEKVSKDIINIIDTEHSTFFELLEDELVIFNEKNIFEMEYQNRRIKYKSIYSNATKISRYDELQINDYVVHYDHGIGQYLGIKTMTHDGVTRDYIYIKYDKEDRLYIPVEQVKMIQKYSLGDEKSPKLSSLGSQAWEKAKARVRERIGEISQKLIKLYAKRQTAVGYSFLPDSSDQILFESDFEYDLTVDQQKAVDNVKEDMESTRPMDRLICGDVGYGKTEVALRAAFKAVYSGKQVAILAPTTILSRQHYHTFKNRMDKFAIKVELLNRFVSTAKQTQILSQLQTGEVDIIVGTHKILNDQVIYRDLGLLIIDEEQRFGVTHKEKIKELKINVDALTLSATPIPRTLQMSILGIKDLSMIETPPKNRYPVQTYVVERNDSIIKEAIERELARGGQIFYMYNLIENIEKVAAEIQNLVPMANVCYAHGKIDKHELEKILCDFIDKKFDVLVCTTIIETGIDIPNCNTLLIHSAHLLGLSQMYQLRGRVGRSNKIAYAYFMYDKKIILTEQAEKRLTAIKELNELGSGFKIAMRDLSIRGAGDILGEDQSGFISSVGLEMYLKILEDEIKGVKPEENDLKNKNSVDSSLNKIYTNMYIDNNYIDNEDVKIEIHKKIDSLTSLIELTNLKNELEDRFGKVNKQITFYMHEKLFRNLCKEFDVVKIDHTNFNSVVIHLSEELTNKMDGNYMFRLANEVSKRIKLTYFNKRIQIGIKKDFEEENDWLFIIVNYFCLLKNKL